MKNFFVFFFSQEIIIVRILSYLLCPFSERKREREREREREVSLRDQRWHHTKVILAGKKDVCLHVCTDLSASLYLSVYAKKNLRGESDGVETKITRIKWQGTRSCKDGAMVNSLPNNSCVGCILELVHLVL